MSPGARIDYKTLRQINPEAARKAVLEWRVISVFLKKARPTPA